MDVHVIAAIACNVERILCFYDEAPRIAKTLPESNRHMEAGSNADNCLSRNAFPLEKVAWVAIKSRQNTLGTGSKRHKPENCQYRRDVARTLQVPMRTFTACHPEGKGIKFAAEVYRGASKPQTVMRTVPYHRDKV